MRFKPPRAQTSNFGDRYLVSSRPPLEQIPESMRELILERDRTCGLVAEAHAQLTALSAPGVESAARLTDERDAGAAHRAGQELPVGLARAKLKQDKADAAAYLEATRAALDAMTREIMEEADRVLVEMEPSLAKTRTKAVDDARKAAESLADLIERIVAQESLLDWLRGDDYLPVVQVKIRDVVPETRSIDVGHFLTEHVFSARTFIVNAATTVLEDPNE